MSDVLQFTAGFAGPATTPLRHAIEYAQTGPFGTQLTADEYVDGGIPVINPTHIQRGQIAPDDSTTVTPEKADDLARYRLAVGDIVLGRKGEVDKSALVNQQSEGYVCGSDAMALRPRLGTVPDYLWWYLQSSEAHSQLEFWSVGTTVSGLNQNTIRKVRLPLPDVQDQQRIASYLDRETARIDTLIEEQQRLIEMLRERRESAIRSVLLTGLDDEVPRRSSGVARLGDIPSHWRMVPTRYLCTITTGSEDSGNATDDGAYPFYVRGREVLRIDHYSFDGEGVMTPGDGQGGTGKVFHYVNGKFEAHQRVYVFMDFIGISGWYFYYFLSAFLRPVALAGSNTVTMESLRRPLLADFRVAVPPLEEQHQIETYLDEQTARMDDLIAESERFIEIARERRSALITAAVTGQIDVREMV